MSKSDLRMRFLCCCFFDSTPLSAQSKLIQGLQAKMFMPACWLEEEDYLDAHLSTLLQ